MKWSCWYIKSSVSIFRPLAGEHDFRGICIPLVPFRRGIVKVTARFPAHWSPTKVYVERTPFRQRSGKRRIGFLDNTVVTGFMGLTFVNIARFFSSFLKNKNRKKGKRKKENGERKRKGKQRIEKARFRSIESPFSRNARNCHKYQISLRDLICWRMNF